MSVLVHRCRRCGHREQWHRPRDSGYVRCDCCRAAGAQADIDPEPVLEPTWTHPGSVPEPLWAPGSVRNAGTMHAQECCGCDACRRATRALETAPAAC
ncbi:hypothetical protein [Piscicoccus intestinalis]|uniref:hypothetical protein n=1 Tax=Piscicoccus intestinalis TaxID=746033 RepID=UPI000838CA0E|nr:hypothetical protein [Piscicoccus intestinalis]